MEKAIYRFYGVNTAIDLLRPGARWEFDGTRFTKWDDPRPCPTIEEVKDTMQKLKDFETSINTIWKDEQLEEFKELGIELHESNK